MEILFICRTKKTYKAYPYHSHATWEIIYSLYGTGTAVVGGKEYPFKKGTIYLIPPNIMHRKTAVNGYCDECIFLKDFVPVSADETVCEDDAQESVGQLVGLMYDAYIGKGSHYPEISAALGEAVIEYLKSWCEDGSKRSPETENFRKLLVDHFPETDFNLTEAMKKTGYSINYFRKIFKEHIGITPLDYLEKIRIEYAKEQIWTYGDILTMKEIAESCGFADPYYFSRVFRKCEGMSPRMYLKNEVKNDNENIKFERINAPVNVKG